MNRRSYLKSVAAVAGGIFMPAGLMAIVGRSGVGGSGALTTDNGHIKNADAQLVSFDGHIMGTSYTVRIAPNRIVLNSAVANSAVAYDMQLIPGSDKSQLNDIQLAVLAGDVADELHNIDSVMSTWKQDSEISHFNRSQRSDWQPLSTSTVQVLRHALTTSRRSMGAFDPTVSPLVDLWGFGARLTSWEQVNPLSNSFANRSKKPFAKPTTQDIHKTLASVGYSGVELNVEKNCVRKLNPNTQIDLSGIAKGFAVDQIARLLDDAGLSNYLIEIGGELRAKGAKSFNTPWKIAIEKPISDQRDALRVLALNNSAVATSGDYRNFFQHDGRRYSHVIDPRYGVPVQHDLVSVTVLSDTTMEADALSTALMIMGPGQALSFTQNHRIAAHFMYRTRYGVVEHHSAAFERYIA